MTMTPHHTPAQNDNNLPQPALFSAFNANGFDDTLHAESIEHLANQLPHDQAALSNQYHRLCQLASRLKTELIYYPIDLPDLKQAIDQFETALNNGSFDQLIDQMNFITNMAAIQAQPLIEDNLSCNHMAIALRAIRRLSDQHKHIRDAWEDSDWQQTAFHLYDVMNCLAYSGLPRLKKVTFYLYRLLRQPVESPYLQRTYDTMTAIIADTMKTAVPAGFPEV